ncbi:hypothetical protein BJ508DRAFT_334365 [Ascobolus immersus RN42]|uniref:Uncharacterized protein n=1 Tax=Ascobolus immersus RN42 TaxID=1160509 RepID=A0A3N4HGC5_ASCIM|nr:hypothetical protein BJ508DRAFT_334365 [Ascobolus immersus RN42]
MTPTVQPTPHTALYDNGASTSFIQPQLAERLSSELKIHIVTTGTIQVRQAATTDPRTARRRITIPTTLRHFSGSDTYHGSITYTLYPLTNYAIILGMDWQEQVGAIADSRAKTVSITATDVTLAPDTYNPRDFGPQNLPAQAKPRSHRRVYVHQLHGIPRAPTRSINASDELFLIHVNLASAEAADEPLSTLHRQYATQYPSLFTEPHGQPPPQLPQLEIQTVPAQPPHRTPYCLSHEEREFMDEHIKTLLTRGYI